jgi:uncharacterized protein (UPF0147 family)
MTRIAARIEQLMPVISTLTALLDEVEQADQALVPDHVRDAATDARENINAWLEHGAHT